MDVLNDLWGHGGALANLALKTVQRDLYNAVALDGLIATQLRATAKAMVIVFDKPPAGSAIWVRDERAREYEPPSNVQAALAQLQQKRIIDVSRVAKRDKFAASFVLDVPSLVWSDVNCQPLVITASARGNLVRHGRRRRRVACRVAATPLVPAW